jgi:signal transduction histidine kinase
MWHLLEGVPKRLESRLQLLSLSSRFLLLLTTGIISAQLISGAIWYAQWQADTRKTTLEMSEHIAYRISATTSFFLKLPNAYREPIEVNDLNDSKRKQLVVESVRQVLEKELKVGSDTRVEFSRADDLKVLNNQVRLIDLPENWGASSLLYKPLDAPILVVQIHLSEKEWLYLATLMPDPMFLEELSPLSVERVLSIVVSLAIVLALGFIFVRSLTRPLTSLTRAMERFGRGEAVELQERGSKELVATARAVNDMQKRIQRYLIDRERLFASISHDLKTPITRLRLRAELLQRPDVRQAFTEDLEDLDVMVKASLQCVKDTDIHETPTEIDLIRLLNSFKEGADLGGSILTLPDMDVCPYRGKPLALKRCLGNLIDNAISHGGSAQVSIGEAMNEDGESLLQIDIFDSGPGIPASKLDRVFEPYTRLATGTGTSSNMGLGLSIARNIARAHGGDLVLSNRSEGGLLARLTLPLKAS